MSIEVSKYSEARNLSGVCCAVVSDHSRQVSILLWQFLLILQPLLMRYVCNHCHLAGDMVWKAPFCWDNLMVLGFAIHEAALLKLEAVQILFYLASTSFQFGWIWCRNLGRFWHYLTRLTPVFRIKSIKIWRSQNWNRKVIESRHVSTELLSV